MAKALAQLGTAGKNDNVTNCSSRLKGEAFEPPAGIQKKQETERGGPKHYLNLLNSTQKLPVRSKKISNAQIYFPSPSTTPTGQWSLPMTCGSMKASLSSPTKDLQMHT